MLAGTTATAYMPNECHFATFYIQYPDSEVVSMLSSDAKVTRGRGDCAGMYQILTTSKVDFLEHVSRQDVNSWGENSLRGSDLIFLQVGTRDLTLVQLCILRSSL
jgi:hypothetical protein